MGELASVFTAITDAIAWNSFSPAVFWRLFRGDGAVAELFRNFLLAERVLRIFGLQATAAPALPPTHAHRLWEVWDSTLELFLMRLARAASGGSPSAVVPPPRLHFFDESMLSFSVWMRYQSPLGELPPPPELPIVLQGLLHPGCRLGALQLLSCFCDFGLSAVRLILLVGARPYLVKLLAHDDSDLPPEVAILALSVWTKMLAFDKDGKEGLLGKDTYRSFFSLVRAEGLPGHHRAFASACLAIACRQRLEVRASCMQLGVLRLITEVLATSRSPVLRWMTALLCAEVCRGCISAARAAMVGGTAEALLSALEDGSPEVRASAVYAIGCILECAAEEPDDGVTSSSAVGGQPASLGHHGAGGSGAVASDAVSDDGSDITLPPLRLGLASFGGTSSASAPAEGPPSKPPRHDRWLWLSRATMAHFGREPFLELDGPVTEDLHRPPFLETVLISDRGLASTLLVSDASALVRYELACALGPWLSDLRASNAAAAGTRASCAFAGTLSTSASSGDCDGADVCDVDSASAVTPTLSSQWSPYHGHYAAPVVVALQAERRFLQVLARDPLLRWLGDVPRPVPPKALPPANPQAPALAKSPTRGVRKLLDRRIGRFFWQTLDPQQDDIPLDRQIGGFFSQTHDPQHDDTPGALPGHMFVGGGGRLRKAWSENCLTGMQGLSAMEDPWPTTAWKPVVYDWTVDFLQSPNSLAMLQALALEHDAAFTDERVTDRVHQHLRLPLLAGQVCEGDASAVAAVNAAPCCTCR